MVDAERGGEIVAYSFDGREGEGTRSKADSNRFLDCRLLDF